MSNIQKRVMASIAAIYIGRVLTGARALKLYALILSVWGIGRLVWVSKIFENFLTVEKRGLGAVGNYIVAAMLHTQFVVQLTLLVAVVAGGLLLVDIARSLATPRSARFAA